MATFINSGANVTLTLGPTDRVAVFGGAGSMATVVETGVSGESRTYSLGPSAYRAVFGQSEMGSTVKIMNAGVDPLSYVSTVTAPVADQSVGKVAYPPIPFRGPWRHKIWGIQPGPTGTALHQIRRYVPFGGQFVQVRVLYNNTAATAPTVSFSAAGSANYADIDPVDDTGAAATFATGTAFVPATSPDGSSVMTASPWMLVYIPADPANPKWGTVVTRTKLSTTGLGYVGSGNVVLNGWSQGLSGSLFRESSEFSSTATITGTMAAPTLNVNFRAHAIDILPMVSAPTVAIFGDSRAMGDGSYSNHRGWFLRAMEALNLITPVGFENWGLSGSDTSSFANRFTARVAATDLPDVVIYQCLSSNDGPYTDATVTTAIQRTLDAAAVCRTKGIAFVTYTAYPSVQAANVAGVAAWRKANRALRAAGVAVLDFDIPQFSTTDPIPTVPTGIRNDPAHLNDIGHQIAADNVLPAIRALLRI